MTVQYTQRISQGTRRHANEIRAYRIRAGLTQKRLGSLIGHRRSVISAWERGMQMPSVSNLFQLARALDTLGEGLYRDLYAAARQPAPGRDRPSGKTAVKAST
jgi:transcriptional regulator with XRE-family HTH domain